MSLPLVDFRGKLTHETDAVLEAMHQATGRDRSEIVREVLANWAEAKIHEASLIDQRLRREGLRGIDGGKSGKKREDEGASGSGYRAGRRGDST
jgi:predicted DNA-binding protein